MGKTDLSPYFGITQCGVLPPPDLFHPVLPYQYQSNLTFPLYRPCVETNLDLPRAAKMSTCQPTEAQHALTGTWCIPQLEEAIRGGSSLRCALLQCLDRRLIADPLQAGGQRPFAAIHLSVFLAAFTTRHVCLRLYKPLHHLRQWVLYLDNDLVTYVQQPIGNYLGDFKD